MKWTWEEWSNGQQSSENKKNLSMTNFNITCHYSSWISRVSCIWFITIFFSLSLASRLLHSILVTLFCSSFLRAPLPKRFYNETVDNRKFVFFYISFSCHRWICLCRCQLLFLLLILFFPSHFILFFRMSQNAGRRRERRKHNNNNSDYAKAKKIDSSLERGVNNNNKNLKKLKEKEIKKKKKSWEERRFKWMWISSENYIIYFGEFKFLIRYKHFKLSCLEK